MTGQHIQGYHISLQQQRAWLLYEDTPIYRSQCALLLEGEADVAALMRAAQSVVDRHEIFRTTFQRPTGLKLPLQVVADAVPIQWEAGDEAGSSHSNSEDHVRTVLRAETEAPLDPATGPAVRFRLETLAPGRHMLVLTAPSMVADTETLALMAKEVGAAYAGTDPASPGDPFHYVDFAAWQAEMREGENATLAQRFWQARDIPAALGVRHPLARPGEGRPFEPARLRTEIDASIATRVRDAASASGLPVARYYLAAWRLLLTRLTASNDLVVAYRVEGRIDDELRGAMGPFSSYVPLRFESDQNSSFGAALDQVGTEMAKAGDWEPYFSWDDLEVTAGPGVSLPFGFDIETRPQAWQGGALTYSVVDTSQYSEPFEIRLSCVLDGDEVRTDFYFDQNRLSPEDVERLAGQYRTLLASVLEHPDAPAATLPLLPAEERETVLVGFNPSGEAVHDDPCAHHLFEEHATRDPDRVAVVFEDETVTYGELNARAAAFAATLRTRGVSPGATVGICTERSIETVVSMLAVLKAEAAYVPLDSSLPARRLEALIEEAGAAAVMGHVQTLEGLDLAGVSVVHVEQQPDLPVEASALSGRGTPGGAAYVIFTSGTTGKPKGVVVEHRQVVGYVRAVLERLNLPSASSFATVSSFAADLGNTAIYGALCSGGCLHVVSDARRTNPDALAEYMGRHRIDCLKIVPSHLDAVLTAAHPERVVSGRRLVVGGEATRWDLVDRIESLNPDCQVVNHYGPTESTVGATALRLDARDDLSATLPIGMPLAGYRAYVLDTFGSPVPIGSLGEIHIGGAGVARGYLGRPSETAVRFVPDPFDSEGGRVYRTGDLGRHLPSGALEFRGRVDHQVKIRGYRVELAEVEAIVEEHDGVAGTVVTATEGAAGDTRLAAYYVVGEGASVTQEELREYTADRLPDYMVPFVFVPLPSFPLNANGKIDRRALPEPLSAAAAPAAVAPSTPIEKQLAEIWSELLRVDDISANADFFDLGGHSLSAMQLISRIRQAFEVELPLLSVFEAPTIMGLAGRIAEAGDAPATGIDAGIEPVDRSHPIPASFSQERLWLVDQLDPNNAAYNIPVAVVVRGPLRAAGLAQTIAEVVRRHEVLRTTFAAEDGKPVQVIALPTPCPLPIVDLSGLQEEDRRSALESLAEADARRPFDLADGPVWRSALVRLGGESHGLLWNQHHICSDAWSAGLFARELHEIYESYADGEASSLGELDVQYADFSVWQRRWLEGELGDRQVEYWRSRLADAPPESGLPTDRPRPRNQTFRGGAAATVLTPDLSRALAALGREQSSTMYVTLLSALATLLHLHSGQQDVVVGSPTAGRSQSETEPMIGFFLNTLALRVPVRGDLRFSDLLRQTRTDVLQAFAHQDLPFERVVDALDIERDTSRSAVYQIMFNHQKATDDVVVFPGLEIERVGIGHSASKFDLTLYSNEGVDETSLSLAYNADLFDEETVQAMLNRFVLLLEAIVEDPDRTVSSLPLLSSPERTRNRVEPRPVVDGASDVEFGSADVEQTIPQRFATQVRQFPDELAVKTRAHEWSYERLDREAASVAAGVREQVGSAKERVGLLFASDAPLFAAMLGTLKAGCTIVPLDPSNPRERLAHMMRDAGTALLLADATNADFARELAGGAVPVLEVGDGAPASGELAETAATSPDDVAYILYTSGSTGVPKGVVQSHRNVLHFMRVYTNNLGIGSGDRLSLLSSYGFDGALMDIFGALLTGATLLPTSLMDEGLDGALRWIRDEGASVYHSTPTVFRQLLAAADTNGHLEKVRAVVLGGEEALTTDLDLFKQHCVPGTVLVNGLGPSESTVTLQHFMDHDTESTRTSLPVGLPVDGTDVVLLDASGEPTDVYGEICIVSEHVALGYWSDDERTRAAFRPDPADAGRRAYRTGDMARRLPDGTLEFVGRRDAQIKIRGFRIEPGEIESVLAGVSGVAECAVLARTDDDQPRLVAYVQPKVGSELSGSDLRASLKEKLPEYMIPGDFVVQAVLPLTPHGKLDRAALGDMEIESVSTVEHVPPQTDVERRTAELWTDLLGIERVSLLDDFFAVGGQSLRAMQLVSRIRTTFEIELPLRALFEAPTLGGMAESIEEALGNSAAPATSLPQLELLDRDGSLPLSFAQQRMWILDQLEPNSSTYNVPAAVELTGPLQVAALDQAIASIVQRHEVLRSVFGKSPTGEPEQVTVEGAIRILPLVDLTGAGAADQERIVQRLSLAEAENPFDLSTGPLLRVTVVRLDRLKHVVLFTMHHIVSDAWSTGVLVGELSDSYRAFVAGHEFPLPPLAIQYADYAAWQRKWLDGGVLQEQLEYWEQRLAGAPDLIALPIDRPRGSEVTYAGATCPVSLSGDVVSRLSELAREEGTTLFVTLLAAFQLLLHRESGQDDIVVGTPVAGRTLEETEPLIGFFINTLVLRNRIDSTLTFREFVGRVRETVLGATAHQDIPFERLVDELHPTRGVAHTPLFQVAFVLQNAPREALDMSDELSFRSRPAESRTAKFDWSVSLSEIEDGVAGNLDYNTDLFDAETIQRVLGHFDHLLAAIASDPDETIGQLSIIGAEERQELLVDWNETRVDHELGAFVQDMVEEHAREAPDASAVVFGDQSLTFGEVNARANQLARHLRDRRVEPGTLVGICVERSVEMVVGLLGILKAGGAYVPLDPSYPRDRLAFMLEDSGAGLVVTTGAAFRGLEDLAAEPVYMDRERDAIAGRAVTDLPRAVGPNSLAYVIYTSGSTGRPKGVAVRHDGLSNLVAWHRSAYGVGATDRASMVASLSFDASVWELWPYLTSGASVHVADDATRMAAPDLVDWLRAEHVTMCFLPTPLTEAAILTADRLQRTAVRTLLTGGDRLQRPPSAALPFELVNHYGPTENTVVATCAVVEPGSATAPPIGRPIDNTTAFVVDALFDPVPVGVSGELLVGGRQVAQGYLDRPGLTAERFVPDPFGGEGRRLYRTGDLVRYQTDGMLDFLGRIDHQVKVRGFRIELGEIEAVLGQHEDVQEDVVIARDEPGGGRRLLAYAVMTGGAKATADDLRAWLARHLPSYMVPAAVVTLDELPVTSGGKVDRAALPDPERDRSGLSDAFEEPGTAAEVAIARIWEDVLGIGDISIDDKFFDLGGHSLNAIQVLTRMEEELGYTVVFNDLIFQTLEQIAGKFDDSGEQ